MKTIGIVVVAAFAQRNIAALFGHDHVDPTMDQIGRHRRQPIV